MGRLCARLCCGGGSSKPNSPGITSQSASSQPTSLSPPMGQLWARLCCCGGGSKPNSPGITSSPPSSHLPPPPPPPPTQYNPTPKTTQEPAPSIPEPPRPAVLPKSPSSSHIGKPNSPEITSSSASSHLPPPPSPQYSPMPKTTQEPAQSTPDPPRPAVLQISSPIGQILSKPYVDINQIYDLDKELRRGEFGITYLCTEKSTGLKYACKSISRTELVTENDIGDVKREIEILKRLRGKPNIVEFKGAYEDKSNLHLVMELCSGGELFDRIVAKAAKRSYSEEEAARIGRQVVNVVHVCHSSGVMHRDLRPENFLLVSGEEDAPLKATEFRLSVFIDEGKVYRDLVGSSYYIAPEVLKRSYGKEIDVWSAGVILYILLSGVPPFWAETDKGIFDEILKGQIDFESSPWPSISTGAKDIIRKMLTMDPRTRITAAQALEDPWLKEGGKASDKSLDSTAVLNSMNKFRAANKRIRH